MRTAFRLPGTAIAVEVSVLPLVAAAFIADASAYTALMFLAAALHEGGHLLTLWLCGAKVRSVSVTPFGFEIAAGEGALSYRAQALCALGGIAVNLVTGVIAAGLFAVLRDPYTLFFAVSCFGFAFVNALPVRSFDGGRAVSAWAESRYAPDKAERMTQTFSVAGIAVLTFAASGLLYVTRGNFSLAMILVYAVLAAGRG